MLVIKFDSQLTQLAGRRQLCGLDFLPDIGCFFQLLDRFGKQHISRSTHLIELKFEPQCTVAAV